MTDLYSEWRDFYAEKVRSWMSLEELRAECGKLRTVDSPSPEVLLVHAMHALEELQAEVERLRADLMEADEIREKLRHLLTRTATALKGEPPAGVWHSWHDLPERAAELRAEVERLRRLVQERDTMLGKRLCSGTNADGKPRCIVLAEERARAERLAEALRELEEREQRDEGLLRQALEALEYYRSGEDYQPTPASEAITALRERLGVNA